MVIIKIYGGPENQLFQHALHVMQAKAADIARQSDIRMDLASGIRRKIFLSGQHVKESYMEGCFLKHGAADIICKDWIKPGSWNES